ncbi:type II toxin-antitoxin system HicB family antitoxin [Vreelandella profundi]|uniref:type II toxin-antitoxin system HicB family antitoxin n=1 Tax=Vreelandella profundi TaxID=2852117 RepID=UPI001EF0DF1C|nr:type II toxin-antitoxin system HicB family antitoxin [Halomonas profundi]
MVNHTHYTYRIRWSEEDDQFVGLCTELPSLSWLADTHQEALEGILSLVSDVVADMEAEGETPPLPLSERHYSGRFNVRIPPEKHRELAIKAAEENISLNRLVSDRLANV